MPNLLQRFSRIAPYFAQARLGLLVAFMGSLIGAATEPMIPALLKPLLDEGFGRDQLPLWAVPLAIVGLFTLRGVAGFIGQRAAGANSAHHVVPSRPAHIGR